MEIKGYRAVLAIYIHKLDVNIRLGKYFIAF